MSSSLKSILFSLVFTFLLSLSLALKGSVQLDSASFDKVISKFGATLVKFDIQYPYGDKHDEYGLVAQSLKNNADLLVTEVGVQDYGDNENQDLADRYGVKKDDFPVIKLFLSKDLENPITFPSTDDFKADRIKAFVRKHTGIRILLDQCLEEFDVLAEKFMKPETTKEQREALVKDAKKKIESLTKDEEKKAADVYLKVMQKVVERGTKFVESERERVKNIMAGKITDAKKKDLQSRLNILQSFLSEQEAAPTASGEVKGEL